MYILCKYLTSNEDSIHYIGDEDTRQSKPVKDMLALLMNKGMANNMPINFPPFDPDIDQTTVGNRFMKYIDHFKNYMVAIDIKDKVRIRALFLHTAGLKVQDILDTILKQQLTS